MNQLIQKVKRILLQPERCWDDIKSEATTEKDMFKNYLIVIAAVPAISGFLGSLFVGENLFRALWWAILFCGLSLAGVWGTAKVLHLWAPNFKVKSDYLTMLKLIGYAFTPIFLAGVFFLIPPIYVFSVIGIYGFYLFWIGLPKLFSCPAEELFIFRFIGIIVIAIAIMIIFTLSALISGTSVSFLSI